MLHEEQINWGGISVVIFDIDGTLYDQRALYRRMFAEAAAYCLRNPFRVKELKILCDFRRERRKRAGMAIDNLQDAQYAWGAEASGIPPDDARRIVDRWLFQRPLRHLPLCRHAGIVDFMEGLHSQGIRTAVYSDYPAREKLKALDLPDTAAFSSVDRNIDCLKPNPKGLLVIVDTLGVSVDQCVFIGDRDDLDGECARQAGMKYLILDQSCSGTGSYFPSYQHLQSALADSFR
jgi:FMN phosphatase YigB (HAD superfamily)